MSINPSLGKTQNFTFPQHNTEPILLSTVILPIACQTCSCAWFSQAPNLKIRVSGFSVHF